MSTRRKSAHVGAYARKAAARCAGYGLAVAAHNLLRRRRIAPDTKAVAPRMRHFMARRYKAGGTAPVGEGQSIKTVTMWAPTCTVSLFRECYVPAIQFGRIGKFVLFTLIDDADQDDDCGGIYHESLLYLASYAFEKKAGIPGLGSGFASSDQKLAERRAEVMR